MKQDEIIEMARQAGAAKFYPEVQSVKEDNYLVGQKFLERFAKLVADKEREECVRRAHIALLGTLESTAARVIHAIRAGGEA